MDDDRRVYLSILKEQSEKYGLEILGWCLMTNHIHLIGRPAGEESLAKALGRTHFRYTQYINRFHGRSGHLWQNRFYSCPLGRRDFWKALLYVEQNPLRAGIVRQAWKYPWSSAAAHVDGRDAAGLLNLSYWKTDFRTGGLAGGIGKTPVQGPVGIDPPQYAYGPSSGRGCVYQQIGKNAEQTASPPADWPTQQ